MTQLECLNMMVDIIVRKQASRQQLIDKKANQSKVDRRTREIEAMIWAAEAAVYMTAGGDPEEYLRGTEQDKLLEKAVSFENKWLKKAAGK